MGLVGSSSISRGPVSTKEVRAEEGEQHANQKPSGEANDVHRRQVGPAKSEQVVNATDDEQNGQNSSDDVANLLPLAIAGAKQVGLVREGDPRCLGHVREDFLLGLISLLGHSDDLTKIQKIEPYSHDLSSFESKR